MQGEDIRFCLPFGNLMQILPVKRMAPQYFVRGIKSAEEPVYHRP